MLSKNRLDPCLPSSWPKVRLGEICEMVSMGEMPLKSYLWLHGDAKLSPQDVKTLCEWSDAAKEEMAKK